MSVQSTIRKRRAVVERMLRAGADPNAMARVEEQMGIWDYDGRKCRMLRQEKEDQENNAIVRALLA